MDECEWIRIHGRQTGGGELGGSQPPLNFGEGGSTPPDFEKKSFLIAHIGPFVNCLERRNSKKETFYSVKVLKNVPF